VLPAPVLGGGCDLPFGCKPGEKSSDFRFAHISRVAFAVIKDETPNPFDIGLFAPKAVMAYAHFLAHTVQQSLLRHRNLLVPADYVMCYLIGYYVIEFRYVGFSDTLIVRFKPDN